LSLGRVKPLPSQKFPQMFCRGHFPSSKLVKSSSFAQNLKNSFIVGHRSYSGHQFLSNLRVASFSNVKQPSFPHSNLSLRTAVSLCPQPKTLIPFRHYVVKTIKVPPMAESISEGEIGKWHKKTGDFVQTDDLIAEIETAKILISINAPEPGKIVETLAKERQTVVVGADLYRLDTDAKGPASSPKVEQPKAEQTKVAPKDSPKDVPKDVPKDAPKDVSSKKETATPTQEVTKPSEKPITSGTQRSREDRRVQITRMRSMIAKRLKESQNTYAMLTTLQECDMTNTMAMRESFKDSFAEKHGVKLGFMSTFVKASAIALQEQPIVNAVIDDKDNCVVFRDYVDMGVAVATPTGLVVPIIHDVDLMSFADIEKAIAAFGKKARDGRMAIEDMVGGTFTISNGGVYGSMMGTPIINPPQSSILGMHAITKRAMVINDQIVIRPMMYLALTYDHRLIDGKDAVTFLRRIKELVEEPRGMLLA